MDRTHGSTVVPLAHVPDSVLALLRRLDLPKRLRRKVDDEVWLRCGSDRSGLRIPVDAGDWLAQQEGAA